MALQIRNLVKLMATENTCTSKPTVLFFPMKFSLILVYKSNKVARIRVNAVGLPFKVNRAKLTFKKIKIK